MLTSKERAFLKRIMATQSPVFQIGKDGLSDNNLLGINQALTAREVIKINILQNADLPSKVVAEEIAKQLKCEVVAVIGKKVILYKLNPKNTTHALDNLK